MDLPTEQWHRTVLEDAMWFDEYGVPFDLRELPDAMFRAHLAILRGKADRRADEQDEADREANRARKKATRRSP